jgi:hypothetical protein
MARPPKPTTEAVRPSRAGSKEAGAAKDHDARTDTDEHSAAIARLLEAFEAMERVRLEAWRAKALFVADLDRRGLLEVNAAAARSTAASQRRNAAAAGRLSDQDWDRILTFRDARRRALRGGHAVLLSGLPRREWEECLGLMRERVWSTKKLRAWISARKMRAGRPMQ